MLWTDDVQREVVNASLNHVLFWITHPDNFSLMQVLVVYGFLEGRNRGVKPNGDVPWL